MPPYFVYIKHTFLLCQEEEDKSIEVMTTVDTIGEIMADQLQPGDTFIIRSDELGMDFTMSYSPYHV